MKKLLLFLTAFCFLFSIQQATATDDADFAFDTHANNILLLRSVILKDDNLTPSEIFDYILSVTELTEAGIEELSELDDNTELKELELKQESLELIKLILEKEGSK